LREHHKLQLTKELEDMENYHAVNIERIHLEATNVLENSLKVQEETFKMSSLGQEEEMLAAHVVELLKRKDEDERSMSRFKEEFDRQMLAACDDHKFQLDFQNKRYEEESSALILSRNERENIRNIEMVEAMQALESNLRSEHEGFLRDGTSTQQVSHEVSGIVIDIILIIIIVVMIMATVKCQSDLGAFYVEDHLYIGSLVNSK
jgi:hypothetical protein